ncbi:hypothetical protein GXW82_41860 [Streptacidiphilus sp. 4-A2]|nr:hypothetical protein [Streptacidiphilus sp. 4-A2]
MSFRTRFLATGLALASGLLTLGTAAATADAASAAAPRAAPPQPLVLSLVKQNPNQRLTPGGSTGVAVMKVSNTTGEAEQFTDNMTLWPTGWLQLDTRDVSVRLTPTAGTPATPTTLDTWGVVHIPRTPPSPGRCRWRRPGRGR